MALAGLTACILMVAAFIVAMYRDSREDGQMRFLLALIDWTVGDNPPETTPTRPARA